MLVEPSPRELRAEEPRAALHDGGPHGDAPPGGDALEHAHEEVRVLGAVRRPLGVVEVEPRRVAEIEAQVRRRDRERDVHHGARRRRGVALGGRVDGAREGGGELRAARRRDVGREQADERRGDDGGRRRGGARHEGRDERDERDERDGESGGGHGAAHPSFLRRRPRGRRRHARERSPCRPEWVMDLKIIFILVEGPP